MTRLALVLLLGVGVCAPSDVCGADAAAAPAADKKTEGEKVELPEYTVLGSRVPRVDSETPAPLLEFTADQIEASGYTNLGDFLQLLPFNSGFENSVYQTQSFMRGASTINPRGLGSNRFLTLLNGRRGITYALTNNNNQSVMDFNGIPMAAIESVEFLKDGASALYGADAVAGVMNIKLKKNFSGLKTDLMYGNTVGHDTGTRQASVTFGGESGRTTYLVVLGYRSGNANFLRDYDVTTTDYTQTLGTNKGSNQNSTSNFPANVSLTRTQVNTINNNLGTNALVFPSTVPSNVTSWTFVPNGGALQATPALANFSAAPSAATSASTIDIPAANRYNFALTYQRYPSYDYRQFFGAVTHKFSEHVEAFVEVAYSENLSYYAFTPVIINLSTEGLTLPANNPYNPFGIALNSISTRSNFGPPRTFDITDHALAVTGGLKGDFGGGSLLKDLHWEIAGTNGYNHLTHLAHYAIRASTYQAALNGTTRATALNIFGPSDNQSLVDGLFTDSVGTHSSEVRSLETSVAGSVADLTRGRFLGRLGLAAGFEYRKESLDTDPDPAPYLGTGGGSTRHGSRNVTSEYAEFTMPLLRDVGSVKNVEVQAAMRREDYNDFGAATKPKFGAKMRLKDFGPADNPVLSVLLRGTYSRSFHAPDLGVLHASQTVNFSSNSLQDPLRPQDSPQPMRVVTGGNPNLLPESSNMNYGGFVVELPRLGGLSFGVDLFACRIKQVIVTPNVNFLLTANGMAQFPDAIVRDNSAGFPGPILRIETVPQNNPRAFQKYRGVDLDVKFALNDTPVGAFLFEAQATRLFELGNDSGLGGGYFNSAGRYFNPKWRGTGSVSWRHGNWGAAVVTDYVGSYFNQQFTTAGWGENPYAIVHPSISYKGLWNSKVTLGVNNVFDHLPPANGRFIDGYDPNIYGGGALGRFIYLRVRHDF